MHALPNPGVEGHPVPWARTLADMLTLTRILCAVLILTRPWQAGAPVVLGGIVTWNMAAQTTDFLDGHLARYSRTPPSRIGSLDYPADVFLAWSVAAALVRAGYLSWQLLALWTILFLVAHRFFPTEATRLGFLAVLHLPPIVLAALHRQRAALIYGCWLLFLLVVDWRKLKENIHNFVSSLPENAQAWVRSWLPAWLAIEEGEDQAD